MIRHDELMALAQDTERAAREGRADCMPLAVDLSDALDQTLALIAAARAKP